MARQADRIIADRYVLSAPLGRGGMGVVWRARDAVLGREVAVKEVVFPPTMPDEERRPAQARVMREARAAARLNHPGAVTLYDVVKDHGGTFIVMELIDAPTLADLVRSDGPLPVERVAEIGAQVASALEAAHQAGIVHRDVKPGNVMVPGTARSKLADFGIASLQGDPQLTSTGLVIGSPAYMAPEQARARQSGPPADLWALGATHVLRGGGRAAVRQAAPRSRPSPQWSTTPPAVRRAGPLTPLITALLAKDPGSRPSGPEVRAWLDGCCRGPFSPAHRDPPDPENRSCPLPLPSLSRSTPAHLPSRRALTPPGVPGDVGVRAGPRPGVGASGGQRRSSGHLARSSHQPHPCPAGPVGECSAWLPCCSWVGC